MTQVGEGGLLDEGDTVGKEVVEVLGQTGECPDVDELLAAVMGVQPIRVQLASPRSPGRVCPALTPSISVVSADLCVH